jgi:hypothetical protein
VDHDVKIKGEITNFPPLIVHRRTEQFALLDSQLWRAEVVSASGR